MQPDEWKWSNDFKCYIVANFGMPPHTLMRGERMIHCAPGIDNLASNWRGSTKTDWHGRDFKTDFTKALKWVQEAEEAAENGLDYWETNHSMKVPKKKPSNEYRAFEFVIPGEKNIKDGVASAFITFRRYAEHVGTQVNELEFESDSWHRRD
jgi:hypothetical protein